MLKKILAEMRLRQWTKNLFVYAALLFNGSLFQMEKFLEVTMIFAAFCFLSSSVYLVNDIFDYEVDRINPDKRHRPIASGAISIRQGYFCAGILFAAAMILSYRLHELVSTKAEIRKVLQSYSVELIDQMTTIISAARRTRLCTRKSRFWRS